MVVTDAFKIPSDEELTVQEINVSTPYLKAGAMHLGKQCEAVNNEFMLCREEEKDPRKCLREGKAVTACALKFFQMVKKNCAEEFTTYATCLDQSSYDMSVKHCRNTQAIFDSCMLNKMELARPHFGYLSEPKIHETRRPKPPPEPPAIYPDALPEVPGPEVKREIPMHGTRAFISS